jgi:hypothetical protein
MQNTKDELRMPADDFDRIMRRALQAPSLTKQPKAVRMRKKARDGSIKLRQKEPNA